jgi:hypothetical protein
MKYSSWGSGWMPAECVEGVEGVVEVGRGTGKVRGDYQV